MRKLLQRRRPTELLLDGVFALWLVSILVTGNVLPSVLTALFENPSPIVAVADPAPAPDQAPELQPLPPET